MKIFRVGIDISGTFSSIVTLPARQPAAPAASDSSRRQAASCASGRLDDFRLYARAMGAWRGALLAIVPLLLLTGFIAGAGTMFFTPAKAQTNTILSADALSKEAEYYNQGTQRGDNGDWNGAADAFKQALQINPNDADAHFELGEAYRELKRYPEAVAEYQAVIRLKPDDSEAILYLGMAENAQGHYATAVEPLKKAISLLPEDPRPEAELGQALLNMNDCGGAVAAFKEVVRLRVNEPEIYYLIGWCDNGLGQYADAVEALKKALVGFAYKSAPAASELGYAYRQLKNYPEAKAAYQRAVTTDAKFAPAHHGLGLVNLALGDKAAAQRQLQILNKLDKTWADKLTAELAK